MKQRKQLALIVTFVTVLTPILMFGTNEQISTINAISNQNNQIAFNPSEIITTTFKGISNVTAFVGPDSAYDLIMEYLDKATTSFYLEVYTLSSEPLVNRLIAAKQRSVEVIVLLSHNRVNAYENNYTKEAAYRLDQAGIDVLFTSSEFTYTHAKFWIVDHRWTFMYSGNWAPSSIPDFNGARTNREMGLMFDDTDIAAYYEDVFFQDFDISTPTTGVNTGSLQANETSGTYPHPFDIPYTISKYMEVTPVFAPDNSYATIHSLLESANDTIDVELQYIKFDCLFLNDLINAAKRGVDVRVLINKPSVSNENVTQTLLSNGIAIRFFKGLSHNHNKYINVDGEFVSVTSINWSNNSVVNNREAGAILRLTEVATYFTQVFDYDWELAEIPVGYIEPLTIVSPKLGEVFSESSEFQVFFDIYDYLSAELKIDGTVVHTWTTPTGLESAAVSMASYNQGIHTVKVIATPEGDSPVEIEHEFNYVLSNTEWLLLISEVRYDAFSEPGGEFFELYNGFTFDVLIGGWIVTDIEGVYVIPSSATIAANDILIFVRDATIFANEMSTLGITGVTPDYIYPTLNLANTGDELILKDSANTLIDACVWGTATLAGHIAWTGSMNDEKSLQRKPANSDTNNCSKDFIADTPTPGVVVITVRPTGFIPGFAFGITVFTALSIILLMKVKVSLRKK